MLRTGSSTPGAMTVCHLITHGGYSPFFVDIARHLPGARSRMVVGSLGPAGELQSSLAEEGVPTFALGAQRRSEYPRAVLRLAGYLRKRRVEVLHSHLVDASLVGLIAARLTGTRVRVMTRHHADAVLLSGSRSALVVDKLLGRYLADHVIAVSDAARRALIELDGVPQTRITVVPNGYDWDRVKSQPDAARRVRQEIGVPSDPLFCSVARLDPLKGLDVLLQAFADPRVPSHSYLLIVGDGPQRTSLERLAISLGVRERCLFTGFRRDVYDVIAACDVVVHPSLSEAQNQVIIEALALGRPVIATDVGAARDIVIPEESGWLVPPRDAEALAQSMGEAMASPAAAASYARAGEARVRSLYPIDRMISACEAVYGRCARPAFETRRRVGAARMDD